jgi:hypothetical protein
LKRKSQQISVVQNQTKDARQQYACMRNAKSKKKKTNGCATEQ